MEMSSMSAKISFMRRWNTAGSIGESKRHDMPFEGAVVGPEGCFPFIIFSYAYKMISMLKIKFGLNVSRVCGVKGIRNGWKGVMIFLGYLV